MNTEVVLRQPEMAVLDNQTLKFIASTEFVPAGLRGNLPAILACVATGRALGIADITALKSIHIIDGKATYSAELMVMLVRRQGHSITGTVDADKAIVRGKRADNGDEMTCEWTTAMAERAGLLNKQNWRKYTESMLWARAASQLCRMLFADCFAGNTYTPEEIDGDEPSQSAPGGPEADRATGASEPSVAQTSDLDAESASPGVDLDDNAAGTPFSYDPDEPLEEPEPRYISEKQRTRLFTIATKAGVPEEDVRAIVVEVTGQESTKLIPAGGVYDAVVTAIQAKAVVDGDAA